MNESVNKCYEFCQFRIDKMRRRLLRDGLIVPLTPKAFDTLLVLIEHGGQVVEKIELMEKVWSGVAVEENNLTRVEERFQSLRPDPRFTDLVKQVGIPHSS